MMHFLHVHHHGEDAGLWPMVQRKDPSTVLLLERMERDHEQIAPAISALEEAARATAAVRWTGRPLLSALAGLTEVLLPHLEREETEAMPVVSATLTRRDWDAYEQDNAIKVKSFVELGDEGQWVLDGLGEEDRQVMLALVPALPRFIVLYGFARRYRRKTNLLWGDGPASRIPSLSLDVAAGPAVRSVGREGSVETLVDASPEQVWAVLTDVTRVGEWSHECRETVWLAGGPALPVVGARFRGPEQGRASCAGAAPARSRSRTRRAASSTAPAADGSGTPPSGRSTSSRPAVRHRTRIVQSFRVLALPRWADVVICLLVPGHQDRAEALTADLERLGRVAGAEVRSP